MLLIEKMSKSPNKNVIQMIQQILDGKALTFEEFISTGLFIPRNNDIVQTITRLKKECKHIIMYMGGFYVQVLELSSNQEPTYFWECFDNQEADEMHTTIYTSNLKDIEKVMWELEVNKHFNL